MFLKHILLLCVATQLSSANLKCQERLYDYDSIVCVCNATYCDTVDSPPKLPPSRFYLYASNARGLRFEKSVGRFQTLALSPHEVLVDRNRRFQSILGFGGAFSDSTGINIASLDNRTQDNLLNSYFSLNGIEYNLGRVPIGGTDFSTREYSYNDGPPDPELENFALQPEDLQYKIPYMKRARELRFGQLLFMGSAWSPPVWMKTLCDDEDVGYFSRLNLSLYQVWADYHSRFVKEYAQQDLPMWGITTGNEPSSAFIRNTRINRFGWMPDLMRKWISENLGPLFRAHYPDLKIMLLDDQRYLLPWVPQLVITSDTTEYIDGIAIHWYYDDQFSPVLIKRTQELFPDKFILNTESAIIEKNPPVALGSWRRGEMYSHDIIQDLSNYVIGWVDWNMALDLDGGPTWAENYIDAAIIVNSTAGEFYKQPIFYHIGHFSKFVHRGSRRIYSLLNRGDNVSVIAFERPDKAIVVVILNKNFRDIPITVVDNQRGNARVVASRRSINTLVYW